MTDDGGIGIAREDSDMNTIEEYNLGPVPFFSSPEIHCSKAPDIPSAMDEESVREEEDRLFFHPALGTQW